MQSEQIQTTPEAMTLSETGELAFVARHPWVSLSAATAAGALIGAASRRLPGDLGERARSGGGTLAAAIGGVALRYGAAIGARKLVDGLQNRFSNAKEMIMDRKSNNGSAMTTPTTPTTQTTGRFEGAKSRAGAAVDSATTQVGRGIESAARGVSSGVQRATDSVSHAGQYLQEATPGQMGADLADVIRRHPKTAIAVGVGVGFLISRLFSR